MEKKKNGEPNKQIFAMKFPNFTTRTERAFENVLLVYIVLINDMFWNSYCC